jgi:mannosyltransferase OCH1-like enzyme
MIPKIIWQTYESEYIDLPVKAKEMFDSWRLQNEGWDHRYLSAKERSIFVKDNFDKEWYEIYSSYKVNVLRADLWRYMCLYIYGGLYCDLDMFCKKPIETWIDLNSKFVVSVEPNEEGYTQSIFASEPKSLFLKNLLDLIKNRYYENRQYDNVIDYETYEVGYKIFTESINKTLISKPDGFVEFLGKDSEKIHFESISHAYAGNGNIFDSNYQSWKTESI